MWIVTFQTTKESSSLNLEELKNSEFDRQSERSLNVSGFMTNWVLVRHVWNHQAKTRTCYLFWKQVGTGSEQQNASWKPFQINRLLRYLSCDLWPFSLFSASVLQASTLTDPSCFSLSSSSATTRRYCESCSTREWGWMDEKMEPIRAFQNLKADRHAPRVIVDAHNSPWTRPQSWTWGRL